MINQARVTRLGFFHLNLADTSSIVHFGDGGIEEPASRVIALQRAIPVFDHDETRFASYGIFTRPLLKLLPNTNVNMQVNNFDSEIQIGAVKVVLSSSSSIIRAGSGGFHEAESRIKHIRQYNNIRDIS